MRRVLRPIRLGALGTCLLIALTLAALADEAVLAAALTCTRAGADPPTAGELQAAAGLLPGDAVR